MSNMKVDNAVILEINGLIDGMHAAELHEDWDDRKDDPMPCKFNDTKLKLKKDVLVILGPHGVGKDLTASIISSLTGMHHVSLSHVMMPVLTELFTKAGLFHDSKLTPEYFYTIRHQYSGYIKHTLNYIRLVSKYAVLNAAYSADIITGIREKSDLKLLIEHGAKFIWVASLHPIAHDPTLDFSFDDLKAMISFDTIINDTTVLCNSSKWKLVHSIASCPTVQELTINKE